MHRHRSGFRVTCALLMAGGLAALAGQAAATTVAKLNDAQLVAYSPLIVEATVTSMQSDWNAERTRIQTTVTFSVARTFKGPARESLTLTLPGGRVGDIVQELVGAPSFAVDQNVILFVDTTPNTLFPITGLHQGKLTLTPSAVTGRMTVAERGIERDEFLNAIERLVATQEEGR